MKSSTRPGDSLAELFRSERAELVRLAAFILSDRSAAEDVVQDVFVRLYQCGYPLAGDLRSYVRRAVVNGCRSLLRRRRLIRRHDDRHSDRLS